MNAKIRECACLIAGKKYPWEYVDRLHSMLSRHSTVPIRLHVLTESDRSVPSPYVKKPLLPWPEISTPDLSWWYKLQFFDRTRFDQPMMYFDLDTVIVGNIDWLWEPEDKKNCFYSVLDFRYLQRPYLKKINSSIMYWNPDTFYWIWEDFTRLNLREVISTYPGDQDYYDQVIPSSHVKFFDKELIKSWRWQIQDPRRPHLSDPLLGTKILIFHGNPKPHEIRENPILKQYWI